MPLTFQLPAVQLLQQLHRCTHAPAVTSLHPPQLHGTVWKLVGRLFARNASAAAATDRLALYPQRHHHFRFFAERSRELLRLLFVAAHERRRKVVNMVAVSAVPPVI